MHERIIDTPFLTTPHLKALKTLGVDTVIRYISPSKSKNFANKTVSHDEAMALADSGFKLSCVYQERNRQASDFTIARANSAGKYCIEHMTSKLGAPPGSCLYIAVDSDLLGPTFMKSIVGFFATVNEIAKSAGYVLGAYASGDVSRKVIKAGHCKNMWLPRALGWSGSRDAYKAQEWVIFQNRIDVKWNRIDYDSNVLNPKYSSFGEFSPYGGRPKEANLPGEVIRERFVVNARSGLSLRSGPGTSFGVQKVLALDSQVVVLSKEGNWASVDLDGDGRMDGYVFASFLVPILDATK